MCVRERQRDGDYQRVHNWKAEKSVIAPVISIFNLMDISYMYIVCSHAHVFRLVHTKDDNYKNKDLVDLIILILKWQITQLQRMLIINRLM